MTILSMTGFGRGAHYPSRGDKTDVVSVEVRAVNSKGAKFVIRTPDGYSTIEPLIYNRLVERFARGTIECYVSVGGASAAERYVLNSKQLDAYHEALQGYKAGHEDVSGEITIALLAGLPGAFAPENDATDDAAKFERIEPALNDAIERCIAMRRTEGDATAQALTASLDIIDACRVAIKARAPEALDASIRRWKERVKTLLASIGSSVALSDENIEREIVLMADRSDVSEEIARLESHSSQFRATLTSNGEVGKKLSFIAQELLREVNTIGSKANDSAMIDKVIEAKTTIEKIKEQVANIE
ncbi:MAG: YicC/YloC family endoribonuclease [Planctomycetota bacterium]